MNDDVIPIRIPACAANLLARPQWLADPGIISRTRLSRATWFARLVSSERFAGSKIEAITLGHTIHIRDVTAYDPHTVRGLALLAHELKHVEQVEREGWFKFVLKYLWAYISGGYGKSVPFEKEAYEFQRTVKNHLEDEFDNNSGLHHCREMGEPHTPNDVYVKLDPQEFQFI